MKPGFTGPDYSSQFGWERSAAPTYAPAHTPQPVIFDAELGRIFIQMRNLLGLTLWEMARSIGGEPTVVANLEAGAIGDLPPWPEVVRLVSIYGGLTGVDPQPILARIAAATGRPLAPMNGQSGTAVYQAPPPHAVMPNQPASQPFAGGPTFDAVRQPAPHAQTTTLPQTRTQPSTRAAARMQAQTVAPVPRKTSTPSRWPRSAMSMGRGVLLGARRLGIPFGVIVVLPAVLVLVARLMPGALYAVVSPFPDLVADPMRAAVDATVAVMAPVRDGLTWIDIGDPRIRKSARLGAKAVAPGR